MGLTRLHSDLECVVHRLPIIHRTDRLQWVYYDYWTNFLRAADIVKVPGETYQVRRDRLLNEHGGYLVSNDRMETEIEFRTAAELTLFLLRWT